MRALPLIIAAVVISTGAFAQSDTSRAMERQARSLERIERIERDRYRDEDRARRNNEVLSRSNRRFDR